MKKMIDIAFGYAAAAMAGGVFYREFTKFSGFDGKTALSVVHTHLFLLGMVMFLLAALFTDRLKLEKQKRFGAFVICYNGGVLLTVVMLLARGILQVRGTALSSGMDAAVSGMAGIGHILTGAGLVLFFLCLRGAAKTRRG